MYNFLKENITHKICQHGVSGVSTVASQQEGSWFEPQQERFCVEFACSPCASMGFLQVLQLPLTDVHVRLIDGFKLPVGVILDG